MTTTATAKTVGMNEVRLWFGYNGTPTTALDVAHTVSSNNMSQFREHWGKLTDADKADLKAGIGDGSLSY